MVDPFSNLASKLRATLDSYRFTASPPMSQTPRDARCLLDWAIAQSGLDDPLTHFNRHELEQAFGRFAMQRDRHLAALALQAKRDERLSVLDDASRQHRDPVARAALRAARKKVG